MGLIRGLTGTVRVELTAADIPDTLLAITARGIPIYDVQTKGELTILLEVERRHYRELAALCARRGEKLRILKRKGFYWTGKRLMKRPLLLLGIGALLAGILYLPGRIFFVRVEGNQTVPSNLILETAASTGIRFGASRREVRSERMKNELLEVMPQLQWAGVNTSGCVATISVRERTDTGEEAEAEYAVSSIVAACDGVIVSCTVTNGNGLCQPGQAVRKGQILISGYTDLGLTIRATRAEGEVYARTRHLIRAVLPGLGMAKGEILDTGVQYSLLVGKKRINLWKDSGISDSSCDRMYEEYYVTLPGGFQLPVALVRETRISRELVPACRTSAEAEQTLSRLAEEYLEGRMVSGQILDCRVSVLEAEGIWYLEGEYLCIEMIGRQRQEKIGE